MSKRLASYTIDEKILEQFNKTKGCYNKSALVESWIDNFNKMGSQASQGRKTRQEPRKDLLN